MVLKVTDRPVRSAILATAGHLVLLIELPYINSLIRNNFYGWPRVHKTRGHSLLTGWPLQTVVIFTRDCM